MRAGQVGVAIAAWLGVGVAGPLAAQGRAAAPRLVTAVRVVVDNTDYQGRCPGRLVFTGTITTATVPSAPIAYQWVRSDGVKGPRRTIRMTGTTAMVTDSWKVGTSGEMRRVWDELRLLAPNAVVSNQAAAAVLCH